MQSSNRARRPSRHRRRGNLGPRLLALNLARHTVHNIQPDLDILKEGRPQYSGDADKLIDAAQVVAIEFQTIAAANNYWRS
ncbi:hexameric tyrosine-coordinated heme protein [Nocardia pseudovaccinii]|uniref:hexameric tyrosine-coordinated heme protein n=1 Tax=Nocardia pseudovaccinii TaxID=189540 RepID=UPI003D93ED67